MQGDFSTPEGTSDFIERYLKKGLPTKGLINNVGEYFVGPLQKTPLETWRGLFESNLHAPFALSMALLPLLVKERGRIVNIGIPNVKTLQANLYFPAYKATKLSLAYLTTCLAKEVASSGVNVNMVSPGYLENSVDFPEKFPMGRPAQLNEVAEMVSFFFEKRSEYITGQNIEVAGGVGL
jgi:NAD(P)-dependent dehydrogenase (short-subunit alcohol dehydrogenase family)